MAVTEADVRTLLKVVDSGTSVAQELAAAQRYVAEHLTGKGLSADQTDDVTLYVAAHLASIGLPATRLKSMTTGPIRSVYLNPNTGEGLRGTHWGQQAIALDPSGTLAALDTPRALFRVI